VSHAGGTSRSFSAVITRSGESGNTKTVTFEAAMAPNPAVGARDLIQAGPETIYVNHNLLPVVQNDKNRAWWARETESAVADIFAAYFEETAVDYRDVRVVATWEPVTSMMNITFDSRTGEAPLGIQKNVDMKPSPIPTMGALVSENNPLVIPFSVTPGLPGTWISDVEAEIQRIMDVGTDFVEATARVSSGTAFDIELEYTYLFAGGADGSGWNNPAGDEGNGGFTTVRGIEVKRAADPIPEALAAIAATPLMLPYDASNPTPGNAWTPRLENMIINVLLGTPYPDVATIANYREAMISLT
jgi:hypothetical protein